MQYTELIKTALDYIEQNLKANITAEELAQMANYSTYHYYRLFSSVMGSSVASYILKRRLDHALAEIAGGRKAIDVVLEYGFDTYAGFYKAFVKMYGCSPKKYLSIYQEHKPKKPEVVIMYTDKELRKILENWSIEKNLPIIGAHMADGAKTSGNVWRVGNDYILKTGSREKKWLDILKGILHGYDLEGKLTPEEKQAVFYVICSIQMICIAYFEKHDMYKELAKTNRQMLNFIIQNKEKIENIFK